MNARQLIENEEEDIKGEMLNVPLHVVYNYAGGTYYLNRQKMGLSWTYLKDQATEFSRKDAVALAKRMSHPGHECQVVPAS